MKGVVSEVTVLTRIENVETVMFPYNVRQE